MMMLWVAFGSVAISTLQPWSYQTPAVAPERDLQVGGTGAFSNTAQTAVAPTCPAGCSAVQPVGDNGGYFEGHCQCGVNAVLPWLLAMGATALILFVLIPTIAFVVTAILYKGRVTDKRPQWNGAATLAGGDFQPGLFACFDDMNTCMHAFFCTACRAADTYQAVNLMWYWTTILIMVAIDALSNWVCPLLSAFIIRNFPVTDPQHQQNVQQLVSLLPALAIGLAFTQKRRQLRESLGGSPVAPGFCCDFLAWSFCSCCVIAQEAKNVDRAQGVQVNCCCELVGQAVNYDQLQMQMAMAQQQQQMMLAQQQQMAMNQKDNGICGC